jgi:hypothetical protein
MGTDDGIPEDTGDQVEQIAALFYADDPEEPEVDCDVPADLIDIFVACEQGGISVEEFGEVFA